MRLNEVGPLKSEEYAGQRIYFHQAVNNVEAKTNIEGLWYMTIDETKREAFHKMKILISNVKRNKEQYETNKITTPTPEEKMRIVDKWLSPKEKLTRRESAILGHLNTQAFGKRIK
jgi:hypothetical protein